jgi:cation diffusion facilitator CzcD-associated flavoprotein CzcO
MQSISTEVLVIGAGPAGLATAACLLQHGIRPEVLERGEAVGTAWRGHYRRLHLHTVKEHSALPGRGFPAEAPRYVPRDQVVAYLDDYAAQFGIRPRFGEELQALRRVEGGWEARCRSGLVARAPSVVLATGANRESNEPSFPGQARFRGPITHSRSYRDPAPFLGKRVLVVGMGNTGAEIALDLAQQGVAVTLSVRSPVNMVLRDVLGRPTQVTAIALSRLPRRLAYAIARKLRDWTVGDLRPWGLQTPRASPLQQLVEEGRTPVIDIGTLGLIRAGRIAVRPGIEAFTEGGVRFRDGRSDAFDAVILATGYRPGLQGLLPGLELPLDWRELPTTVAGSGALQGLYFVGFDIRQPGGLLRTIGQQALAVAQAIAAQRQQRAAAQPAPGAALAATRERMS